MNNTRKILAILLALVLVLALSVSAFADEPTKNDSITVNGAKAGETYSLYKLFDLVVDSETAPSAYTYTVNADWADFFAAGGAGAQYITKNAAGAVTAITDAEALAKAAAAWANKPAAEQTVRASGDTVQFTGLEDGYWLITSTLGTFAMAETTPANSAVSVNEKNPEDTIEKEVKEDSTNHWGDSNDAQIGDTIEFRSTVKIVKGTRNVVVHDTMTSGLTFSSGSIAIQGLTEGTEYTVNESPADGHTFDISFSQSWIDSHDFGTAGYIEYVITYTATLNENAITSAPGVAPQTNTTNVSYGDGTGSTSDSTTTTTHKFNVFKHAAGSTDNLAGATFELKKAGAVVNLVKIDDNNYRVAKAGETGTVASFTTVAVGDIVIWGVDSDDDYSLHETAAPAGYNPLTAEQPVTVGADNNTRVDVENQTGSVLPGTGGIGTTIFYIVGGILVVGAAVVLISKKRMNAE